MSENNAEKVHQILTWILEGNSEHLIREAIADTWPGEESEPLIIAAFEQVSKSGEMSHEQVQNWCFEATRFLYQKQVEIGEYAGAMRAVRQMQEISAARTKQEPVQKHVAHHHTHELGVITNENIDEHRHRLAERIAELRDVTAGTPEGCLIDRGARTIDVEAE